MNVYQTKCGACGRTTTRAYARAHDRKCKSCATGKPAVQRGPSRSDRIIDQGWEGYAREEGHYDNGGDR